MKPIYHPDTFTCFLSISGLLSPQSIHNLRESFPVPSFLPASPGMALQAVLHPRSERPENARCRACLADWFTPSKSRPTAFSERLNAYPLRFVNDFTPKLAFCALSLKNSYISKLYISSRPTLPRPKSYPHPDAHLCRLTLPLLAHSHTPTLSRPTYDAYPRRCTLLLLAHSLTPAASLLRPLAQRSRSISVERSPSCQLVTAFPGLGSLRLPNLSAPTANRPTRQPAQRTALAACRSCLVTLMETNRGGGVATHASHFDRLRWLAGLAWEGSRGKVRRQRAFPGSLAGLLWGRGKTPRKKTVSCWGCCNVSYCWLRTTKPVTRGALFTVLLFLSFVLFVLSELEVPYA